MIYYRYLAIIFILNTSYVHSDSKAEWGFIHNLTLPEVTLNEESISKRLRLLALKQAQQIREGIYWSHFEKNKRVFLFEHIASRLSHYDSAKVLGLFAYSNNLYARNDKFYTHNDWRLMHRSAVALENAIRKIPNIYFYEILNEMNSEQYFESDKDPITTYKQLLGVLSRVLRRNDKNVVSGNPEFVCKTFDRIKVFASASGENIAAGNSTAERTYWQWYHSPGHHRNMFNPKWSRIGVGYVKIEGSPFVHYWTTDFGY